jgi:DNA-directed RNA polymerase subunit RPC12/RpoP
MTSANANCLTGIRCPYCGSYDAFYISAEVLAYVTDDGAEAADNRSIGWDADSSTECAECGADGPLSDFTVSTPI